MPMRDDDPFAALRPIRHAAENVVPLPSRISMDDLPDLPVEAQEEAARWSREFDVDMEEEEAASGPQWPTAFTDFNEAAVQPRRWIYGRHYLRGFVSVLASAGGIGKTSLQIVEALAIATGKPLLGEDVHESVPVWIVNLEDPMDEMQRRILAAMRHFGIRPEEVRGRLFVDAGREMRMKFATQTKHGILPNAALMEHLVAKIPERNIGQVFIDPFVSSHEVNENDNMAINAVVDVIRSVADATQCGFGIVHHIRKGNGEDASIDSVRGAGSLIGAARAARVINKVTEEDAIKLCVSPEEARGIFRVDDGKANLAPPADASTYRRMIGVQIANGEWVGVAVPMTLPDAFDGVTVRDLLNVQNEVARRCQDGTPPRYSDKSPEWIGILVAETLGLDTEEDRPKVKKIVSGWMKSGSLRKAVLIDAKRMKRPVIEVGEWAVV